MNSFKVVAFAVAGLIGLLVVVAVALLVLVDPNSYRGAIESRVREASGRPFAIAGKIKLEFFPWLALDVGEVTIGNPEGFGAEPLLRAERARVGARLLPLLRGRLEVSRIALDGLRVTLVKRKDGHANWEGGGDRATASRDAGSPALPGASIAGVDLTGATLVIRDEAAPSVTRLRDIEFHCGALGPARSSDLEFRARADAGDGTPVTRVELRTQAMIDTGRSLATLTGLKLTGDRTAPGSASVPFTLTTPEATFDWSAGKLAPAKLELRYGGLALSAELAGEQLFGERRAQGRIQVAEQSPRVFAPTLGWAVPATRDPQAFTRLAGAATVRLSGHALAVEDLDLLLDRGHIRGRITIADLQAPAVEFELHADAIDLDAYRGPATPADAATEKAGPPRPLPVAALRALNARGSILLDHTTLAGLTLTDLRASLSAHDGDLHVTPSAKAFGGTISGDVRLDASHDAAGLTLSADIRGVDIGAAVKAYAKSDRLSGRANATARLTGSGATDAALIAALAGPIDFEVKDGALEGLDVRYEIERAQVLLQRQVPPARSGPARTPFDVLSGRSRLERGILATDPVRLETQVLKMAGRGTFRLSDQAVDYQLSAVLQEAPPALASLRGTEIPLTITGTVRDYKVRPDLGGIVKGRVKQELEKRKGEIGEKLKDVLKDLIPH